MQREILQTGCDLLLRCAQAQRGVWPMRVTPPPLGTAAAVDVQGRGRMYLRIPRAIELHPLESVTSHHL